jgi:CDP-4-dehydro-6-deoxyglucose reductase
MRFWPGQYIMLGDDKKARPYSIANINNSNGELVLYVTKLNGGNISQWIHDQLNEGDIVNVSGPYGTFIGRPGSDAPVLCLAAGSGLAPIMSLATAALMRGGFTRPATIVFSARTQEDIYEKAHFQYLQQRFSNFKFIPTLTQEKNPAFWQGRIPTILADKFPDLSQTHVYIAGPVAFVEDCKQQALKLGLKAENLFLEGFHSQHQ